MEAHVIQGDCVEVMRGFHEACIDAIVTDPPAGIAFMSKEWDDFRRARNAADVGRESVFGRTLARGPEYGRGERANFIEFMRTIMLECFRVLKPGGHALVWAIPRTSHWTATAVEDAGFEVRDVVLHLFGTGFPKSLNVGKELDAPKKHHEDCPVRHGASADCVPGWECAPRNGAARWDGWGTALKPAAEHWILARKPLEGTVAANVQKWGTGAINIDACRIHSGPSAGGSISGGSALGQASGWNAHENRTTAIDRSMSQGRWPANVVLDEWQDPILRLKNGLNPQVERIIRLGFGAVHCLSEGNEDVSKSSGPQKVLRPEVLRGVVVGRAQRNSAPDVREEAQSGVSGIDAGDQTETRTGASGAEQRDMEERSISVQGVSARSGAGKRVRAGAQTGDGETSGATPPTGRDCSPPERCEDRQQTEESGDVGQCNSQTGTPSRGEGASEAASGERELEACASEIPEGWLTYFEETGRFVRRGAGALLDAQTGERSSTGKPGKPAREAKNFDGNALEGSRTAYASGMGSKQGPLYSDTGGASRFFYCAKTSRAERDAGCEDLPVRDATETVERAVDSAGVQNPRAGASRGAGVPRFRCGKCGLHLGGGRAATPCGDGRHEPVSIGVGPTVRNHHPTVKPVALMRWLVRLVTPPGGVVLDPFAGSGSTGVACAEEGFDFVGVEREAEYVEIAEARIERAQVLRWLSSLRG